MVAAKDAEIDEPMLTRNSLWMFVAVILAAGWLYWPALSNQYAWDDSQLFVNNPRVSQGEISWDNLVRPILPTTSYIRPVAFATFIAEVRYLGFDPVYSHSINYGLYLLNVALVMLLTAAHSARRATDHGATRITVAGAIYAFHPALVETAAWSSGRFDLLVTFFVLLALFCDLKIVPKVARAGTVATLFALALGSKETAAVLPGLLLVQRLATDRSNGTSLKGQSWQLLKEHRQTVLLCGLVFAVYMLVRMGAAPHRLVPQTTVAESLESGLAHLAYVFRTVEFYAEQILAPIVGTPLPMHLATPESSLLTTELAFSLGGFFIVSAIGILIWRRRYSAWMLTCALLALLPVLNIVVLPLSGSIGNDRFLTLPLAFIALAIGGAPISMTTSAARVTLAASAAVIAFWMAAAILVVRATIPRWYDDATLWAWMYNMPELTKAVRLNYTSAMLADGHYMKARMAMEEALKEGPLEATVQLNYGYALAMTGEPAEGAKYIEGAISVYPVVAPVGSDEQEIGKDVLIRERLGYGYFALAEARLQMFDAAGALSAIETSIAYRPGIAHGYAVKSIALEALGRSDDAKASIRRAEQLINPALRSELVDRRAKFVERWNRGAEGASADDRLSLN